jgi:hypothetical protein
VNKALRRTLGPRGREKQKDAGHCVVRTSAFVSSHDNGIKDRLDDRNIHEIRYT